MKHPRHSFIGYPNTSNFVKSIGVRAGGRGGLEPPQLEKFLKFFGQNADDSGKST